MNERPHSIEAEQALLGSLMVNDDAYDLVSPDLRPDHFYEPLHQRIFEVSQVLAARDKKITPITLKPSFENDAALSDVGGMSYLARLATSAIASVHARDYAKAIIDLAARRELINLGTEMRGRGEHMPVEQSPDEALDEAEERIFALRSQFRGKQHQGGTIGTYAERAVEAAREAVHLERIPGLATGIGPLDEKLRLRNGHMIVVAGRPGSGKSSLVLSTALNVATGGHGVYFASLEMPGEELATRAISAVASQDGGTAVPYFRIERGQLDEQELDRINRARSTLAELPIFFDTRRALRIGQIAAGARRYAKQLRKADRELSLIVIDHIGKARDSGRWGSDKTNAVSEVSSDIHALAGDMNIPVIAVSQLNRAVEARDDKRPVMSDLRASGTIEEDAHLILTVFRPAYYLEREKPDLKDVNKHADWETAMRQAKHHLDVVIAKQRGGPTGPVSIWCDISTNTFRGGS